MDRLFLGYVKLNGKKCAQKLKDGRYLTLAQARKLDGYGGVLAPETIFGAMSTTWRRARS